MTQEQEPVVFSPRFSEALRGAADLHAKQVRKGTTIPYVAHLLGVASIALQHGADEDEAIAALLHDAIEDAPEELGAEWVRRWLSFRFGDRVREIVEACTDADVKPKPAWRVRKEAYVAHVAERDTVGRPGIGVRQAAQRERDPRRLSRNRRQTVGPLQPGCRESRDHRLLPWPGEGLPVHWASPEARRGNWTGS